MTLLSAILNSLAVISLAILVASYFLAWQQTPRLHILAFIFFFTAVLIITTVTTVKLWGIVLFGQHISIPVTWVRPTFLLVSSLFLLYTTWRKV